MWKYDIYSISRTSPTDAISNTETFVQFWAPYHRYASKVQQYVYLITPWTDNKDLISFHNVAYIF